jgi:hypothetical protein
MTVTNGTRPDLSIVIPTYGSAPLVATCVRSICAHADALTVEIIVVDDDSPVGVKDQIQSLFPDVLFLRTEKNLGYGGAANLGLERCRGRFLVVSNDDVTIEQGALSRMVDFLESHPDAGAAGPRLLNPDGTVQKSFFRKTGMFPVILRAAFPSPWLAHFGSLRIVRRGMNRLGRDLGSLGEAPQKPRRVANVMGAFIMMRRAVFERLRGFDSQRFYLFAEEVDLFLRMRKAGWTLYYLPEARVTHLANQTIRHFQGRYVVQQYKSLLFLFEKHFSLGERILYRGVLTLIFGAKMTFYLAASTLPGGQRLERRKRFETYVSIIKIFFDKRLRSRNVFHEMRFTDI